MGRVFGLSLVLGMLSAATCGAVRAGGASIVSVSTPRGVQQAFILIKPDRPVASVILFEGGIETQAVDRIAQFIAVNSKHAP